jgi:hypothetical protein
MSWSVSTTVEKFEKTDVGLQIALEAIADAGRSVQANMEVKEETSQQVDAAVRAAHAMIVEGGFDNAETISISLSGHANPEHKMRPEWANDYISVQIYISKYRE